MDAPRGAALWTDAYLDAMRQERDPVAAAVVEAVYASGDLDAVNQVLVQLVRHGPAVDPLLQKIIDSYFEYTAALPPWTDPAKLARAEGLFSRHGLLATSILCCASLPECYLDREGVPVLAATQRLEAHTYRRIWETSHMIISVMQPNGLSKGPGVEYCQRVRLMHAAIAHLLLAPSSKVGAPDQLGFVLAAHEWDAARLGMPLNQEDLAYVLLTFSYVGLRGLEKLGVAVTQAEREAYVHAWNVVGALLGIREELMARDYDEARVLFERIKARRRGASPEGQALTRSLVAWMEETMPEPLRHVPSQLVCALVGDKDAALLGVRRGFWGRVGQAFVVGSLRLLSHVVDDVQRHSPLRRGSELVFQALVRRIWNEDARWKGELFTIPPALQQSWGLRSA